MNSVKNRHFVVTVMIMLLFATISACAKKTVTPVDQTDVAKIEAVKGSDQAANGGGQSADGDNEAMGGAESLETQIIEAADDESLEGRTTAGLFPLYFDFDDSSIRSDQVERVEKNAAFMKNNPGVKVRIEGNCDERGTNEYNMALGQRRALSGKQYMVNLGVAESRLDTISYGEEQPINFGHDELSWSQNRRDDFVTVK